MIDYTLYLCTNSEMNKNYTIEECVEQAIKGGVTFVQVREKNKTRTEFLKNAQKIKRITDIYGIPLVINDNIDIAIEINADGVHIGQSDISCLEARKKLGKNKIIGVTVTNLQEAKEAISQGATYLGVGAIYKSKTKRDANIVCKKELQKIVDYSKIPVIVIGGINKKTIPKLSNIKISGYAVIGAILREKNIIKVTKELKKIIYDNRKKI